MSDSVGVRVASALAEASPSEITQQTHQHPGNVGFRGSTYAKKICPSIRFNSLLSNGAIFGSALIANIGYYLSRHDRNKFKFNNFYTLIALIIIPQLIIYNKTGILWHYILPGAVSVSFLAFYPMRQIAQRSKKTYQTVILMILTILTLQLIFTTSYFFEISKRTTPIQGMVSDLSRCVSQNAPLAIVGNSYVDYEALTAFYQVTDLLIHNNQTVLATYGSKNADLSIDVLKAEEQPWYFSNPLPPLKNYYHGKTIDRLNPQELMNFQGIVLTHSSKVEKSLVGLNLDWFGIDRFAKKYYPELDISIYCKKSP